MRLLQSWLVHSDFEALTPVDQARRCHFLRWLACAAFLLQSIQPETAIAADPLPMWSHIKSADDFVGLRNVKVEWFSEQGGRLEITSTSPSYAWVTLDHPPCGWDLSQRASVEAEVKNEGDASTEVQLWVVADRGWEPVSNVATLKPGESSLMLCDLRQNFKDGTPKLNPERVTSVRVLLRGKNVKVGT